MKTKHQTDKQKENRRKDGNNGNNNNKISPKKKFIYQKLSFIVLVLFKYE